MPEYLSDLSARVAIVDRIEAEAREELERAAYKIKACRSRRTELFDIMRQFQVASGVLAAS